MRVRTALIAATAISLAATTPALAAKKPVKVCNLIVDDKGDGTWNGLKSDGLDLVSADIATGGKEMVGILRLAKAPSTSDPYHALSYEWNLGASGNGVRYEFHMRRGMGPNPSQDTRVTVGGTEVPHTFAISGSQLIWKFKRAAAAPMAKPKIVWGDFGANSKVLSSTADRAASEKKYADRAPSCVAAG